MDYVNLGMTGLRVSRLGFGMWPIGGTHGVGGYGSVDFDAAKRAIRRALDLGISLFDTAASYGEGRGEAVLADAIGSRRDLVTIITKCGVHWDDSKNQWTTSSKYDDIIASADKSLGRLKTNYIDVLLLHVPDPNCSPQEPMRAFADLKASGRARYVGVSNFSVEQIREYLKFGQLDVIQPGYHMFDRRAERELLPFAQQLGLGVTTYGVLAHGLLGGQWTSNVTFEDADWRSKGDAFGLPLFRQGNLQQNIAVVDRLKEWAATRNKSVAQVAVAWVLDNPAVHAALTGAREPAEIESSVGGVGWKLSRAELVEVETILKDAAGTSPDAPDYIVNRT